MRTPADISTQAATDAERALAEDIGDGDVSAALIAPTTPAQAQVITRTAGTFCGRPWVDATVQQVEPTIEVEWLVEDGDQVEANQVLFRLKGPARSLLTAERTILNFVQLLSGTATRASHYVDLIKGTNATLLDTRKTVPGLRVAQKYAVTCGGGQNHRMGLYDAYLLKENHIAAAGSITAAVKGSHNQRGDLSVEVEVETLAELEEAIAAGADIAMIDNFSLEDTKTAVAMAAGKIKLEASGGIDEVSITEIAATGVDYISIGDLTKTVIPMDLSMRFVE